ncbi:hypothetical protein GDO86_005200 [Hymenochirus boettgeri]|uniref:Zona pellucida sperm-binding protein 4 n=1 Tax=Hymenochirus boettgeri TaxID=247094 RepID=A0A8T2J0X6_9PIPI|nr:hypothetical protein GDO86_005200 [Hymenochirus boettgeri]
MRGQFGLWGVWLVLLVCSYVCCVQRFWDGLHCGLLDMQFTVPSLVKEAAFVLSAVDHTGNSRYLINSTACGTWLGQNPNGLVVVGVNYDGCYVREEDGEYRMTVSLEEVNNGQVSYHKQVISCPTINALDAPSPDICSAIKREDRLLCAAAPVSQDICQQLGCCFSPVDSTMPCYYGNTWTAQCTDDNNMVIAISKDLTKPSLILNSVSVAGVDKTVCPALSVSKTNSFLMFQFPLSCGAVKRMDGDVMTYENTLISTRDIRSWTGGSITRDSTMKLTVRCIYGRTGVIPLLKVQVNTLPPPPPVSTPGPLVLEMRISKDAQYSSYYGDGDYPVVKILRDLVYLEVRILRRLDPNLVLILHSCWATPSPNPTQLPQWPILQKRCPFPGDNYLTQLIPVGAPTQTVPFPSHYQRFSINTFTFVDATSQAPLGGVVYFQCSASVCVPSASNPCRTVCSSRKRRMAEMSSSESTEETIVTSDGPVNFVNTEEMSIQAEGEIFGYPALHWARGAAAAGGILSVALITVGLWMFYRNRSSKIHSVHL